MAPLFPLLVVVVAAAIMMMIAIVERRKGRKKVAAVADDRGRDRGTALGPDRDQGTVLLASLPRGTKRIGGGKGGIGIDQAAVEAEAEVEAEVGMIIIMGANGGIMVGAVRGLDHEIATITEMGLVEATKRVEVAVVVGVGVGDGLRRPATAKNPRRPPQSQLDLAFREDRARAALLVVVVEEGSVPTLQCWPRREKRRRWQRNGIVVGGTGRGGTCRPRRERRR